MSCASESRCEWTEDQCRSTTQDPAFDAACYSEVCSDPSTACALDVGCSKAWQCVSEGESGLARG